MKKNPIVHFEIPAENKKRAQEFYSKHFGWDFADWEGYTTAMTTEVGEDQKPTEKGMINGGLISKEDSAAPLLVINVPNMEEKIAGLKKAGMEILIETKQWGDFGLYSQFKDSEGNVMGLWQDLEKA